MTLSANEIMEEIYKIESESELNIIMSACWGQQRALGYNRGLFIGKGGSLIES